MKVSPLLPTPLPPLKNFNQTPAKRIRKSQLKLSDWRGCNGASILHRFCRDPDILSQTCWCTIKIFMGRGGGRRSGPLVKEEQ